MISKAGGLVKENLKGSLEIASEGCYVYLRNSDPQTNDSSVIRLLVAQEAVRMGGSVQTSDSTSNETEPSDDDASDNNGDSPSSSQEGTITDDDINKLNS